MPPSPQGEVLFVTSSYPRWAGDASAPFVHHLAQDLRALGWDVRVLAPHAPGAQRDEVLDGVPIRRFRYFWPTSLETVCYDGGALVKLRMNRWLWLRVPFLFLFEGLAVLSQLLRRRTAIVHTHWLLPQGLTAGLAAALCRRPHIATVHGSDVFALQGAVSRGAKQLAIRLADAVTVNSRATEAAVAALGPGARIVERIPMGATAPEAGALRSRADAGPVLAFAGRLVPEKGVGDLLEAVARLRASFPALTALVIGDGPERAVLEQQASRLGVAGQVRFLGWLPPDEALGHLRGADVLVGPSRPGADGTQEAQGIVLAEAMLAGVPVVATSIGGIPDAIRDGETGLLVEPGSPQQIADAVRRLLDDPALAARLAAAACALAEAEFTREASARRFSALYARLLPGRPQPAARAKT